MMRELTIIQYVNSHSLNEALFSAAQSLFAHVSVGQTCRHTNTQTHGFSQTNVRKSGMRPQPAEGMRLVYKANVIHD